MRLVSFDVQTYGLTRRWQSVLRAQAVMHAKREAETGADVTVIERGRVIWSTNYGGWLQ